MATTPQAQGRPGLNAALAAFRALRGMSPGDLALAARVRTRSLLEYEQGRATPRPGTLARLAAALGTTVPVLEALADVLAPFGGLRSQPGPPAAGAIRSALRLAEVLEGSLAKRLAALPREPLAEASSAGAERRLAPWLWERLRSEPAERRRSIVREGPEFHRWGLSELLSHRSAEAAADDADEAVALAELALLVARLVPGRETWRRRVQGYAGAHLGNAHRVRGDLPAAGKAFGEALSRWRAGAPGDPEGLLDEARVLGLEASLRRAGLTPPRAR